MSAGFPYCFMPKNIPTKANGKRSLIVDGGLLSNFPLWVFNAGNNRSKRPVVGMKLNGHPAREKPREIKNAIDMFQALFSTMLNAHDARYVSTSDRKSTRLNSSHVSISYAVFCLKKKKKQQK